MEVVFEKLISIRRSIASGKYATKNDKITHNGWSISIFPLIIFPLGICVVCSFSCEILAYFMVYFCYHSMMFFQLMLSRARQTRCQLNTGDDKLKKIHCAHSAFSMVSYYILSVICFIIFGSINLTLEHLNERKKS